ncbi:DUF5995 family protein [Streptomyces sp. NPDC000594]|uniref:DUF5995 family protein n=1 Tax=Streptomyces sp. NPDC000594 TaxID=3154261 RepID=UPI0033210FEE
MAPQHSSYPIAARPREAAPAPPGTAGPGPVLPGVPGPRGSRGSAGDGVAVCRRILLTAVRDLGPLDPGGGLPGRRAAAVLGALATRRSLRAVAAARPPACWRPLLRYRHHPRVHPAQFALAGLNAHIGHDLALAVVDACETLGCEPARLESAFDQLGDLLALIEEGVREELLSGPEPLRVADPLAHLLGSWSPRRACDSAWSAARLLWRLREQPALAAEFRHRLDGDTGLVGRCLLVPRP